MKFGILVKDLGQSELNWRLISNANYLIDNHQVDIIFFYEDLQPVCVFPRGATMQIVEAYDFKYPLIATNFTTAQKLCEFPRQNKSYYYLWDLEWMRYPNNSFEMFNKVYGNPNLELIARSTHHKFLLENLWNRPVNKISETANLMEILNDD